MPIETYPMGFCVTTVNAPVKSKRSLVLPAAFSLGLDPLRFADRLHGRIDLLSSLELERCFDDGRHQPDHDVPFHVAM